MGLKLFDGSDSENENISKIEINQEYAKRYEHNKKREDLQRFEELKKKGMIHESNSEDSESESFSTEDEDDKAFVEKDLEFFDALIKVKKHDPVLTQKDVKLFDSDDERKGGEEKHGASTSETEDRKNKSKKKSMYLKDVMAKHLIEEGPEFTDKEVSNIMSYNQEQEEIRKAFIEAANAEKSGEGGEDDDDEEDGLFKVKKRSGGETEEQENENVEYERRLDEYFGGDDGQLDENSKFLKEYFMNKLWLDRDKGKDWRVDEDELKMVSEDEAEIEKQEEYEYRFQENVGDRVLGHSRTMEGSVRKKKNSRKEQRKKKEERMEIARLEREEELKHLKNLKKKEVKEKLKRIRETAGIAEEQVCLLDAKDLDEEFDPEEYDKMMEKAFGDEYYEKEDIDLEFGSESEDGEIEKPDFEKEDELLGLPKKWDSCEPNDGFLAARERSLKHKEDNNEELDDEEEEKEEEGVGEKGNRKRKHKVAIYEKAKEAMMEEYYKLDYEDTIGELKTRFKYSKIAPNRYGLTAAEILAMDDKELNQYVSLKKLAPYKEKEWKVPNSTRFQMKMRARELLRGGELDDRKRSGKKKRLKDRHANRNTSSFGASEDGKSQNEESSSDAGNLSRNARRRRRQAGLKLTPSRLMAYGKITSRPKKKAKH